MNLQEIKRLADCLGQAVAAAERQGPAAPGLCLGVALAVQAVADGMFWGYKVRFLAEVRKAAGNALPRNGNGGVA